MRISLGMSSCSSTKIPVYWSHGRTEAQQTQGTGSHAKQELNVFIPGLKGNLSQIVYMYSLFTPHFICHLKFYGILQSIIKVQGYYNNMILY